MYMPPLPVAEPGPVQTAAVDHDPRDQGRRVGCPRSFGHAVRIRRMSYTLTHRTLIKPSAPGWTVEWRWLPVQRNDHIADAFDGKTAVCKFATEHALSPQIDASSYAIDRSGAWFNTRNEREMNTQYLCGLCYLIDMNS
jgi:hypothetical protein